MKKREKTAESLIMVVDDHPMIVRQLEAMLTAAGYRVIGADSGQRALELLETLLPDLILLDIDMPGLSGLEVCRIVKENQKTSDIPIIFVTVSDDKNDIVAGFAAGAQDYVVKPSTKEELLARVRIHLTMCKTQQELKASRAKYRELSFLDDLTGFYNTRYLYKTLQAHLDKRPDRPVAVAFLDIDKFKQVVDARGHLNGSRAIAELAAVIKPLLPKGGYGVSYGGDEFVLVLPGHDGGSAALLTERIRRAVAEHPFLTMAGHRLHLTVSCGVASYPADADDLVTLLGNADHALFEAKHRGRNTVVSFAGMHAPRCEDVAEPH